MVLLRNEYKSQLPIQHNTQQLILLLFYIQIPLIYKLLSLYIRLLVFSSFFLTKKRFLLESFLYRGKNRKRKRENESRSSEFLGLDATVAYYHLVCSTVIIIIRSDNYIFYVAL